MLGELTREEEPDSSLHFTGGDSGPLVVVSKTAGLSSNGSKRTDYCIFYLKQNAFGKFRFIKSRAHVNSFASSRNVFFGNEANSFIVRSTIEF